MCLNVTTKKDNPADFPFIAWKDDEWKVDIGRLVEKAGGFKKFISKISDLCVELSGKYTGSENESHAKYWKDMSENLKNISS